MDQKNWKGNSESIIYIKKNEKAKIETPELEMDAFTRATSKLERRIRNKAITG